MCAANRWSGRAIHPNRASRPTPTRVAPAAMAASSWRSVARTAASRADLLSVSATVPSHSAGAGGSGAPAGGAGSARVNGSGRAGSAAIHTGATSTRWRSFSRIRRAPGAAPASGGSAAGENGRVPVATSGSPRRVRMATPATLGKSRVASARIWIFSGARWIRARRLSSASRSARVRPWFSSCSRNWPFRWSRSQPAMPTASSAMPSR